jgi:hypothetical protein
MGNRILAIISGPDHLAWASAESSVRGLKVLDIARFELDPGQSPLELLPEGKWDRVLCGVGGRRAAFRFLDFPFRSRQSVQQVVGSTLEAHVPMTLEESAVAWDWAGFEARPPVLAAMADSDELAALAERVSAPGRKVDRLVWTPACVLEIYRLSHEQGGFVALDVGHDETVLGMFDEQGQLADLRVTACRPQQALLERVAWAYRSMSPASRLVIVGGVALNPSGEEDLVGGLKEALGGCDLQVLPPDCPLGLAEGPAGDWRSHAALLGMIYAAGGNPQLPVLDFLPGLDTERNSFRPAALLRPLLPWAIAAATAAILAIGLDLYRLDSSLQRIERRAADIYTRAMFSGETASDGTRSKNATAVGSGLRLKMEMKLSQFSREASLASSAASSGLPLRLMAVLSATIPADLPLTLDSWQQDGGSLRVAGVSDSFESVNRVQQSLEESGSFASVEIRDVHSAVNGKGVNFQLTLVLGDVGPGA